jgi:hypothetical protein
MNHYTKNSLIIFTVIACHSVSGMEHPQLQLESQKKQLVKYVTCSIMIPKVTDDLIVYGMKTVHDAIFEHSNLQSNIKDPIIHLHVQMHVQNKPTHNNFYVPLPAKLFINCTDKSILHLHETDGSKLFKSHPVFKKIPLKITATCIKNPNLKGNSFAEQFNNAMNEFYEDPGIPWVDAEHEFELDAAGIIKSSAVYIPQIVLGPYGPLLAYIQHITFEHGPNGCPNNEIFMQAYFQETIQPQLQFIYWALKNYQWDKKELLPEIIQSIIVNLYLSHKIEHPLLKSITQ